MIHKSPLPKDIEGRLRSLGQALEECPVALFAYLFGGAARQQETREVFRRWLPEALEDLERPITMGRLKMES